VNFGYWALKEAAIFWAKPYNNNRSQYIMWEKFEGPYYFISDEVFCLLIGLRKPQITSAIYEKMSECGISQGEQIKVLTVLEKIGFISYSRSVSKSTGDIQSHDTLSTISPSSKLAFIIFLYYIALILLIVYVSNLLITRFSQLHVIVQVPALEHFLICLLIISAFTLLHEVAHGTMLYIFTGRFPKPICIKPMTKLLILPAIKINLNLTYLLDSHLQRIAVLSAGLFADCIFICFSFMMIDVTNQAFLWIILTWVSLISFALNFLPFWNSDGYYILTEILQFPNLNSCTEKALQKYLCGERSYPVSLVLHGAAKILFEILILTVFLVCLYRIENFADKTWRVVFRVIIALILLWHFLRAFIRWIKEQGCKK